MPAPRSRNRDIDRPRAASPRLLPALIARPILLLLPLLLAPPPAHAQLTPDRLYVGVNRPLPMTVSLPPESVGTPPRLEIWLHLPNAPEPIARAATLQGRVDLAALLPQVWTGIDRPASDTTTTPATPPNNPAASSPAASPTATPAITRPVLYAQLMALPPDASSASSAPADNANLKPTPLGPPVVLQPMLTPMRAVLDERDPRLPVAVYPPARQARESTFTGVRTYIDRHVILETDAGTLEVRLRPDAAPNTAWNFRHLVEGGFYTDIAFHRIVAVGRSNPERGFVIQAGDPTATGEGGPGYELPLEPSTLPHDFGVLSMARDREPNTAGSQFFIALSREETARLDGQYTAFAQVVGSAETLTRLAATPVLPGRDHRPVNPPKIRRAFLRDAPPFGQAPTPVTIPPLSAPVER